MTNAKSRLVRIIALALVVLMVVPMALVGCGQDPVEIPDNSAEIEAALAAAQAAKDAADKAAADAQAAIDAANKQIEEAKKAAADAQAKAEEANKALESMKNTTTTAVPATTTAAPAPTVDKAVLDAHISDILYNEESEFNKAVDEYLNSNVEYLAEDEEALEKLVSDAMVAILRAETVDYANQIVAAFIAALDAVPTLVERIKMAYDEIDFASDVDVIDVVYAYNLLKEATPYLSNAEKAELEAYGEEKVDVAKAIKAEYARYTGVDASTYAIADADVLYKAEYTSAANLAKEVADIYGTTAGYELDVADIVYFATIKAELDGAVKAYQDWAKPMKDDVLAIYADLCIAFAGEKYILVAEGDYLNDALEAAKVRVAEILLAVDEFKDTILKPIQKVVKDADGNADYSAIKNKDKVDNVADLLAAWIAKYDLDAKDEASIDLIATNNYYSKFLDIEETVDATYAMYEAALALDLKAIEKAYDEFTDDDVATGFTQWNVFSYSDYFAAVEALELWYFGTWKDATTRNADGFVTVVTNAANKAAILDEVFDMTEANLVDFIGTDAQGYRLVKAAKAAADVLNRAIANVDTDEITNAYYAAIQTLENDAKAWVAAYIGGQNIVEDGEEVIEDMINYDLIDWDAIEVLWDAYDATIADIKADSIAIVETYIALYGTPDADEEGVIEYEYKGTKYAFDLDALRMNVYFGDKIAAMKAVYEQLAIAKTAGQAGYIFIDVETVEGENATFTLNTVIDMYLAMHQEFYYVMLVNFAKPKTDSMVQDFKGSTFLNAGGWNEWKNANATVELVDGKYVGKNTAKENQTAVTKLLGYLNDTNANTKDAYFTVNSDGTITVKGTSTKIAKSDIVYGSYSMISAYMAVKPEDYATKNSSGKVTAFNGSGYVTAVNAKITEYKAKWVEAHIADLEPINSTYNGKIGTNGGYYALVPAGTTTVLEMAAQQIQYISQIFLAYGVWNIADEVEIDGEVYTFELLYNNDAKTALALVMYDEDGDIVTDNKIAFTKIENGANVNYEYVITPAYGKDVQIMAVGGKVGETAATVALSAIDDATDEKLAPKFIYTLADNLDEIFANYAKFSGIKNPVGSAYDSVTRAQVETVLKAYDTNKFYGEMYEILEEAFNYTNKNTISGTTYGSYAAAVKAALVAAGADATEFETIIKNRTVESFKANKSLFVFGADLDALKTICKTLAAEADAVAAEIVIAQNITGYVAPSHADYDMFN